MNQPFIPSRAQKVIDLLNKAGYEAFLVGGSLRDAMLQKEAHDIDITTNALPHQTIQLFQNDYHVIEYGSKFGTINVIIDSHPIEITTYRSEGRYEDGRHPQKITFEKEIFKDLSRRDFTINAMAFNKTSGLIDLFGGKSDLENRIIRCVGDPKQRFQEDKLRMLRAIRFASNLNFEIDPETFQAIRIYAKEIHHVSIERINQEFSKMLLSDKPSKAILSLQKSGLLKELLPVIDEMVAFDQQNPYHKKDLFFHTLEVLDNVKPDLVLRLAALFHDCGKLYTKSVDEFGVGHFYGHDKLGAEIAKENLKKLKYPNSIIEIVFLLVQRHMIAPSTITAKGIRKLIALFGVDRIDDLIQLQKADSKSTAIGETTILEDKVREILNQKNVFSRRDLKVDGYDMMKFGFYGKDIRKVTDFLMEIVLEHPDRNKRETLLDLIKQYAKTSE